jgi:hypothetical protein
MQVTNSQVLGSDSQILFESFPLARFSFVSDRKMMSQSSLAVSRARDIVQFPPTLVELEPTLLLSYDSLIHAAHNYKTMQVTPS